MYSATFKSIFVHIPKTGGQSIEQAFLQMHGLAWNERRGLLLGKNRRPDQGPRRLSHLFALEYCEFGYVSRKVFASCLKFATVRNPFDRLVSEYRYRAGKRALRFTDFIKSAQRLRDDRHFVPQSKYLLDGAGRVIVDRILRFETLGSDFEQISQELFGRSVELSHTNKSASPMPSREMSAELADLAYRWYECDFDLFKYPTGREYHLFADRSPTRSPASLEAADLT